MSDRGDIVRAFLAESQQNLDQFSGELAELEEHPSDGEILASAFRTMHTLKGTSGFLAFSQLEAVSDAGETLLRRVRRGQLSLTPEISAALAALVKAARQILAQIETQGNEGEGNHRQLIAGLIQLLAAPGREAARGAEVSARKWPAGKPPAGSHGE